MIRRNPAARLPSTARFSFMRFEWPLLGQGYPACTRVTDGNDIRITIRQIIEGNNGSPSVQIFARSHSCSGGIIKNGKTDTAHPAAVPDRHASFE